MTQIFYALVISTSLNLPAGTTNAVFPTREPCLIEAKELEKQGISAICLPVTQPTVEQMQHQTRAMMQLFNSMRREMESK